VFYIDQWWRLIGAWFGVTGQGISAEKDSPPFPNCEISFPVQVKPSFVKLQVTALPDLETNPLYLYLCL